METISSWPKTLEEMIAKFQVDTELRKAEKLKTNTRQQWQKVKNKDWSEDSKLIELRQTLVEWKPKYGETAQWSVELLEAMMKKKWIVPPKRQRSAVREWQLLWWVLFSDLHFDRADIDNTPITKRMKYANEHYKRALDRVLKFDPSRLLVWNLWDTFNSDWRYSTTSWKNYQQNSVHEKDAFKYVLDRSAKMLEYVQQFKLPTEYAQVGGNHDKLSSQHLWMALQAYFRNSNIKVTTKSDRFYKERGNILLMLSHWQDEKPARVLEIAVNEFVKKKYNQMYSYMWHKHIKEMQQVWPMVNKRVGSLVPPSEWEAKFGYRPYRGMSWYVWDKQQGEIADLKG